MGNSKVNGDNSLINIIDDNISHGVKKGVLHLSTNGINTLYNGKKLVNFSSYSYLGLEHHPKLKDATIKAVEEYGTQFGYSRAFVSVDLYDELESKLEHIFDAPVVLAPSTTLAHQAVMPVLMSDKDTVLIDQYAHASMHFTIKNIKESNVPVELIRHNNIEKIEDRIKQLKQTQRRIWYVCDGVYSMYGDFAPVKELEDLMNKYPNFYVYFDDAHGLSWIGKRGRGYVLNQINMHDQMVVVTSLNKAFAASGGAVILPNNEWKRKIRTCGGPMIFSTPIQPPMLAAGIASANMHLDSDFDILQNELTNNINYLVNQLDKHNLPDISESDSPIFYLPTSYPKVSYNLTKRMMTEGFYLTPALFPAVSMRRAGIRYCVNAKNTTTQIKDLVQGLSYHYEKAVNEEEVNFNKIFDFFKIEQKVTNEVKKSYESLSCITYSTIEDIDESVWNNSIGKNGAFDWHTMLTYEKTFRGHKAKQDNWEFYYIMITNQNDEVELATVITKCWCKDDLFKPARVSRELENLRKTDEYLLCSETLMMGTMLTEGSHLYQKDKSNKQPISMLLDTLNELQNQLDLNSIYLRDFDADNTVLSDLFIDNGFIKIEIPEPTNVLECDNWETVEAYLASMPKKKRKEIKSHALNYEHKYKVDVKDSLSDDELKYFFKLYKNVKRNSFLLNTFDLPFKFFEEANASSKWEFIVLTLNDDEYHQSDQKLPVSIVLCNKSVDNYIPQIIGLNYKYLYSHKIYRQSILQIVKRGITLKSQKIYFGITATIEKKRFGAKQIDKTVFVQVKDTFNMDVLKLESYMEIA